MKRSTIFSLAVLLSLGATALAQDLSLPARNLPAPRSDDISPAMQAIIAAAPNPNARPLWKSAAEARATADADAPAAIARIPDLLSRFNLTMTPQVMDGVRVHVITPRDLPAANRNRVLVHLHGGCYVLGLGQAGAIEGLLMAGLGRFKVISVDYRMPPEAYFPAALDDAVTVYRAAIRQAGAPRRVAVFGTSAGGALTLQTVLKAKALKLPMAGAIAAGTPMSDATKVGDSFYTNEGVDNVLVSRDGFCDAATKIYANGHDLKDPLISPVYGDMKGFPPAILTSGTRDLLLSNTVRSHRALRRAGVVADLHVYEGQSHAHYGRNDAIPETREAFGEIAAFFDRHLAR